MEKNTENSNPLWEKVEPQWIPGVGDIFAFGTKGAHRVDETLDMKVGAQDQTCLVLNNVFSKKISRTFLPVGQLRKQGSRPIVSKEKLLKLETEIFELDLSPVEFSWNSNKKILYYEKEINESGFSGLIHSYFCILKDLEFNGEKSDKRFIQYSQRMKELVTEEVSLSFSVSLEEATSWFEKIIKKLTSH